MRPLVLSSLTLLPLAVACVPFGAECNARMESQVTLDVHMPQTLEQLAGDTITICRNGACSTGVVASLAPEPDGGTEPSTETVNLTGAPFPSGVALIDEADGFTRLDIGIEVGGLPLADGDTYKCTVSAPSGAALFDVERPAKYDEVDTCGSDSKQVRMELYPESTSGLTCGNGWCSAGVTVRGSFSTNELADPLVLTLCRGSSLCASGTISSSDLGRDGVELTGGLSGGVLTTFDLSRSGETIRYELQTDEDSAALQDGDSYTLTISQAGTVRASGSSAVTYSKSYPNGPQCDPVPCREATLNLP